MVGLWGLEVHCKDVDRSWTLQSLSSRRSRCRAVVETGSYIQQYDDSIEHQCHYLRDVGKVGSEMATRVSQNRLLTSLGLPRDTCSHLTKDRCVKLKTNK